MINVCLLAMVLCHENPSMTGHFSCQLLLLYQDRSSGGQHSGGSLLFNLFMFCDGAADDLKAAFALYSFACPLMLTATSIYYLHR